MKNHKGIFITFEGSEGSGKSTQIDYALRYFKDLGKDVLLLREPGGVKISEKIRNILLDVDHKNISHECEMLLYMASRAQLVTEILEPALKQGKVVLCDRFLDSTVVYQGYGNAVNLKLIKDIGRIVTKGIAPDLTFIFDIDVKAGLSRINRAKDRIEQKALAYHDRVRRGYQAIAKQEPKRIKLIDGSQDREVIREIVKKQIDKLIR